MIALFAEKKIRSWNSAATALFGFTEEEVIGQPIELIIPERFRKLHREGLHRVSTGGPSREIGKTVEVAAVRKNGSEFPVEFSLATWFLDKKRYYTGIIRDISERKQAEQSSNRSPNRRSTQSSRQTTRAILLVGTMQPPASSVTQLRKRPASVSS